MEWISKIPRKAIAVFLVIIGLTLLAMCVLPVLLLTGRFAVSWSVGLILWALVYIKLVLPHFTFLTEPDQANMLSSPFIRESAAELETFSGLREIRAQKEYQAGWHLRLPGEIISHIVDMRRQIIITEDKDRVYTFGDGKTTFKLEWQVITCPLPGNILDYIRTDEKTITTTIKGRLQRFSQGYIGDIQPGDFSFGSKGQKDFEKAFRKEVSKSIEISRKNERSMGISISSIELIDMDKPTSIQEAENFRQEMKALEQAATEAVAASQGTLTYDAVYASLMQAYMAKNGAKFDLVNIRALGTP